MFAQAVLLIGCVVCGAFAIREARLLYAALWLAATSAFLAAVLYWLGAALIAVIELSVGAGLVTVLLVLAIGSTERGSSVLPTALPRAPALALAAAVVTLLATLVSAPPATPAAAEAPFAITLWQQRGADMLLQIGLIFVGLLTVLGLLAETVKLPPHRQTQLTVDTDPREDTPQPESVLEKDLSS